MKKTSSDQLASTTGAIYLKVAWEQELGCKHTSEAFWLNPDNCTAGQIDSLGGVLLQFEKIATCFWGCQHDDHIFERMMARVVSHSRSALRLISFGFYDDAFSLIRNLGELANLLVLFSEDAAAFLEWKSLSDKERQEKYKPFKVREKLEKIFGKSLMFVDSKRYKHLCELGTHVIPTTNPQAHHHEGLPTLGGYFNEQESVLAVNELSLALVFIVLAMGNLAPMPPEKVEAFKSAGEAMMNSMSGAFVTGLDDAIES